jgi:hypothetical protein
MTTTSKPLYPSGYAPAAETTVYGPVSAGVRTIIDKCTGYNAAASSVSLTVRLVPNGGTAGASNTTAVKTIAPGTTYTFPEIVGQVLGPGEFVSMLPGSASSIVVRLSGREVT